MRAGLLAAIALMAVAPANAQDFSEGSEAKSWNLFAEQPARFTGQVVDLLCEVTGDCPADCGAGLRQMGLVREADNVLITVMKNSQPAFTGGARELAPFCGQVVEVDGLMLDDEFLGATNVYLVQKIRAKGDAEWIKGNTWTKKWAAQFPEAKGKGPWFRRDPRIKADIAENGYLGLGLEIDRAFLDEEYK